MTKEEFLELMGKGSEDEDKKLIEAIEKVFEEKEKELEHSDEEDEKFDFIDAFIDGLNDENVEALSEILEHHGIDGQKWGVRNGPPYPLERQKGKHLTSKAKAQLIKDNIDDLSLEEIEKLIKRIEFEEKLDKMTAEEKKKGNSFASQILQASGKAIVSVVVPAATTFAIKKLVQKYGGDDNLKLMFPNKK